MSLARHASYNLLGSVVPLAVSLVTVPLYIEVIGVERYGVLALFWLVLGFSGFLDLGMGPAVAQRIATLRHGSDEDRLRVFWTAFWMNAALGVIGALLVFLAARLYFAGALVASSGIAAEIEASISWLALGVPVVLLSGLAGGALRGRERFLALNTIGIASSVLIALLPLLWAFLDGPELQGLLPAALVGRAAALLLMLAVCRQAVPLLRVAGFDPPLMRGLLVFGGWVTLSSILVSVLTTADQFVIGAIAGAAGVALYAIPFNVVSRLSLVPTSVAGALFPRFASSSQAEAEKLQADALATLSAIMAPLTVLLIAAIGPFLHVWIGPGLGGPATTIAYVLIFGIWMNSTALVPHSYLQASGRPDLPTKLQLAYLLPYCGLLYVGVTHLGVVGAALVWSLRSCFDPTLYVLAGSLRRALPIIAPATLIVLLTTLAAWVLHWSRWPHWLAMAGLLLLAVVFSLRTLPAAVWTRTDRVWTRLPKPIRAVIGAIAFPGERRRRFPDAHAEL